MSETETSPPQRPSVEQKGSAEMAPKDIEKSSHDENAIRQASYIPQSDEGYNVTFKTWIVVWVSIGLLSPAPFLPVLTFHLNRFLHGLMASHSGSCQLSVRARLG